MDAAPKNPNKKRRAASASNVSPFPQTETASSILNSVELLHSLEQVFEERLKTTRQEIEDMEYKRKCMELALYLFREYKKTNKLEIFVSKEDVGHDMYASIPRILLHLSPDDHWYCRPRRVLMTFSQDCLAYFGLKYKAFCRRDKKITLEKLAK